METNPLLAQPIATPPRLDVDMQMIVMGGIAARPQDCGEMQAGGPADRALKGLLQVAAVLPRLDLDPRAVLKTEGGNVESIAKSVLRKVFACGPDCRTALIGRTGLQRRKPGPIRQQGSGGQDKITQPMGKVAGQITAHQGTARYLDPRQGPAQKHGPVNPAITLVGIEDGCFLTVIGAKQRQLQQAGRIIEIAFPQLAVNGRADRGGRGFWL